MNTKIICQTYGIVFIGVGIAGFVPNPIVSSVGFFVTNGVHNSIHILLGLVFIIGAGKLPGKEHILLKLLGVGGLLVTVVGFLSPGDTLLGVIQVNPVDHWLHLGLALLVLASGYVFGPSGKATGSENYSMSDSLIDLCQELRGCTLCASQLPLPSRPVFQLHQDARILIAGQAPGRAAQRSGIPFSDASGKRLRQWMGIDEAAFYTAEHIAILPMACCYPGKGVSGDLPPLPICAEFWRVRLLKPKSCRP